MNQKIVKLVMASLVFVWAMMGTLNTHQASAHTVSETVKTGTAPFKCYHQYVHLNGIQPATITCLDQLQGVSPNTGSVSCPSADVILYWDLGFTGPTLCLGGHGYANLTDYWNCYAGVFCSQWNDNASGYSLQGCALIGLNDPNDASYPGYFAVDSNGNGQKQYFKWNISKHLHNFDGTNQTLPDNSLSSVNIDCFDS